MSKFNDLSASDKKHLILGLAGLAGTLLFHKALLKAISSFKLSKEEVDSLKAETAKEEQKSYFKSQLKKINLFKPKEEMVSESSFQSYAVKVAKDLDSMEEVANSNIAKLQAELEELKAQVSQANLDI